MGRPFLSNTGNAQQIRFFSALSNFFFGLRSTARFLDGGEDKSGVAGQGRGEILAKHIDESALYVAAYVLEVSGSFYFELCCSSRFGRSSRGRKPTFQSNSVVWRPAHWNILQSWPTIFTTTFSHPGFKQSMEQSRLKALSTVESTCVMKCDVYICEELYAERRVVGGTATSFTIFMKCDVDIRK